MPASSGHPAMSWPQLYNLGSDGEPTAFVQFGNPYPLRVCRDGCALATFIGDHFRIASDGGAMLLKDAIWRDGKDPSRYPQHRDQLVPYLHANGTGVLRCPPRDRPPRGTSPVGIGDCAVLAHADGGRTSAVRVFVLAYFRRT